MREVGNRDKSHEHNDFGNQPTDFNGEVTEDQPAHNRQRIGKHIGRVHGSHPQTVHNQLHQEKLPDDRNFPRLRGQTEPQKRRGQVWIPDKQKPERREKQRCPENDVPQQADISSRQRRKIKIVCFLQEIEKRGRQNHDHGRVVAQKQNVPLQQLRGGSVRTFGIPDLRERIVPTARNQQFSQGFVPHRQRLCRERREPLFQPPDIIRVRAPVQIADRHVCLADTPNAHIPHGQRGIPYTAADQRGIQHQCFRKTVPRAENHAVGFGFFHRAHGIGSRVDNDRIRPKAVRQHQHRAGQNRPQHPRGIARDIGFDKRQVRSCKAFGKALCVPGAFAPYIGLQRQEVDH